MDTATAGKKSRFILSDRSDFHPIDILLIAFHAFASCVLTSLSVDEILLSDNMNWSTNFRGLPIRVEMTSFLFKTYVLCFISIYVDTIYSRCLL